MLLVSHFSGAKCKFTSFESSKYSFHW